MVWTNLGQPWAKFGLGSTKPATMSAKVGPGWANCQASSTTSGAISACDSSACVRRTNRREYESNKSRMGRRNVCNLHADVCRATSGLAVQNRRAWRIPKGPHPHKSKCIVGRNASRA